MNTFFYLQLIGGCVGLVGMVIMSIVGYWHPGPAVLLLYALGWIVMMGVTIIFGIREVAP